MTATPADLTGSVVAPADPEPVRLHLSESPYGPSPAAQGAARAALDQVSRYPDPKRAAVVEAVAAHWDVPVDRVAVGNGSDELVLLSALAVGWRHRPGLATASTFPGYRICLEAVGRGCIEVELTGTRVDAATFAELLPRAGVGYLCHPHNPSGAALSRAEMDLVVAASADSAVPLIVDEAYLEFAPAGTPQVRDYLDTGAPVLALRTFSKAYGLAGIRIGYALGHRDVVGRIRDAQGTMPFSVNSAAQAAAVAALADRTFLDRVRAANAVRREGFAATLRRRGRASLPSVTNFVAVAVSDPRQAEARLEREHRVLVRAASRFGFPGHLRVSLGEPDALTRLLDALDVVDPIVAPTSPSTHVVGHTPGPARSRA